MLAANCQNNVVDTLFVHQALNNLFLQLHFTWSFFSPTKNNIVQTGVNNIVKRFFECNLKSYYSFGVIFGSWIVTIQVTFKKSLNQSCVTNVETLESLNDLGKGAGVRIITGKNMKKPVEPAGPLTGLLTCINMTVS